MENENMVGAVSASEAQESVSGTAAVGTDAGIDTSDAGSAEDGTSAEVGGRDFTDHEGEDTGAGSREEDDGASEGEGKPAKGEQSTDERRENARKRREREEQAKLDAARKEARATAIIEVLGGVNPYTKAPMKDAHDVAAYERMKKIEASGGNPTEDYAAAMAEDAREAEAKEAKAAQDRRWYADDRNAFEKAYPDVKLDALLVDPDFIDYARAKVEAKVPMVDIYRGYKRLEDKFRREAEDRAAQAVANARAGVGGKSSEATPTGETFFTKAQVEAMSAAEITRNQDTIWKSMQKW